MENDNKIIFDQVKEYFEDAVEVISLFDTKFLIKDCNFNTLHIEDNSVFVKRNGGYDVSLYDLNTKEYAKIVTTTPKLKVSLNTSKNWLEGTIWSGGSSVTPEILRELTEPRNEAKRLKVGGIYKSKKSHDQYKSLLKVTKDDGEEICGYGFIDGKFDGKDEVWFDGMSIDFCRERLQETTIEKWEKALLKYKK